MNTTLGTWGLAKIRKQDEGSLDIGFLPYNNEKLPVGALVKLRADGTIELTANASDAIGIIKVTNQQSGLVTVKSFFSAVVGITAKTNLSLGDYVKLNVADTLSSGVPIVEATVSGDFAMYQMSETTNQDQQGYAYVLNNPVSIP